MKKKTISILIATLVLSSIGHVLLVYSQCGPFSQRIPEKDIESAKKHLTPSAQKDMQAWDDLYKAVRIGKTSQDDTIRLFGKANPMTVNLNNAEFIARQWQLEEGSLKQAVDDNIKKYHSENMSFLSYGRGLDGGRFSYQFVFVFNTTNNIVQQKFRTMQESKALPPGTPCLKPVIYFYPTKEQDVSVHLHYAGNVTVSYPKYDPLIKGWTIRAYPDGKIIDRSDKEEYSYIFWEGSPLDVKYDLSEGFVVEGEKTETFLRDTLKKMGLKPREYNEFIVYWFPKLKKNKYNLVHFAHEEYENLAKLEITPKPDSLLRVFMVYQPLTEKIEIKPQIIKPFIRSGFTVVEWGGAEFAENASK